jgi:N-acetylmuramoyl-L-alanine amidase
MKFKLSFLLLFIFSLAGYSQNYQSARTNAEHRIKTFIDPDGSLSGYYSLSDSVVKIFANPADKKAGKAEFTLRWSEAAAFNKAIQKGTRESIGIPSKSIGDSLAYLFENGRLKKDILLNPEPSSLPTYGLPLSGKRIALDPGHMAGDSMMAQLEGKCLFLKHDAGDSSEFFNLIEGQLTLATAYIIKDELEKLGATVMMTRTRSNESAFGMSYEEWLRKEMPEVKLSSAKKIFHDKFKSLELLERARKINEFQPDLTLIIHYNVDETNTGWSKPGSRNFTMAFIGGNVITKNLAGQRNRLELLRMIVTDDLDNSEKLAGKLVENFVLKLKIPAAKQSDAIYLKEESLKTGALGVYSRNLALTRLVHGPLAYGESLYQDNFTECKSLCDCRIDVQAIKANDRVKQVADCYVKAVMDYYSK